MRERERREPVPGLDLSEARMTNVCAADDATGVAKGMDG